MVGHSTSFEPFQSAPGEEREGRSERATESTDLVRASTTVPEPLESEDYEEHNSRKVADPQESMNVEQPSTPPNFRQRERPEDEENEIGVSQVQGQPYHNHSQVCSNTL
jgi:hypothetical protein